MKSSKSPSTDSPTPTTTPPTPRWPSTNTAGNSRKGREKRAQHGGKLSCNCGVPVYTHGHEEWTTSSADAGLAINQRNENMTTKRRADKIRPLFSAADEPLKSTTYEPLPSVWT